jgi:hypothetical protein
LAAEEEAGKKKKKKRKSASAPAAVAVNTPEKPLTPNPRKSFFVSIGIDQNVS